MQEDFYCFESGVAVVSAAGWPATDGAWVVADGMSKAGNKVGTLLGNSPPIGWQDLGSGPRGNCRRSDVCGHGIFRRSLLGR